MKIISDASIQASGCLTPSNALKWVRESFSLKSSSRLPHKTSIPFGEGCFMNTMPCMVPDLGVFGVKVVTRYPNRMPSIAGDLLLYSESDGNLLALMEATQLTAIRTGAVAALAVETFARRDFSEVGIMGLGATGRATLSCLVELFGQRRLTVHLLDYKEQATETRIWLEELGVAWKVDIISGARTLVRHSDVLISCITVANNLIAEDADYRAGCLVVPVHTRGFQNCDLFFDRVFADDTNHVSGFRYFERFKSFAEFPDVLGGRVPGRENNQERILSYNIGIALHDVVFAYHIYRFFDSLMAPIIPC